MIQRDNNTNDFAVTAHAPRRRQGPARQSTTFSIVCGLFAIVGVSSVTGVAYTKETPSATPSDPNTAVAKSHGGKVWIQRAAIPEANGNALAEWLASNAAVGEIVRVGKDGPWTIQFVAVFKKPAVKGPLTVQIFDKTDPKEIVESFSPANEGEPFVYFGSHDLSDDLGFNKNHTYSFKVGQILKGKFLSYAVGEFSLK